MAQANFTPISLYFSTTAAAAPTAGNLVNGELAINITDGKLYFKNNAGVVTLLASAAGAAGDVVGPASSTDNALARFDSTTGKLIQNSVGILSDAGVLTGLTGLTSSGAITLSSLTSGRVTYAGTAGLLQDSANLTFDGTTLTANALTVSNAVTLSGGTANGVAYLNGSKVLTTGSALIFTGTNLGVGVNPTNAKLEVAASSGEVFRADASGGAFRIVADQTNVSFNGGSNVINNVAGSEIGRFTSTGLGVGESAPAWRFMARAASSGTVGVFAYDGTFAGTSEANVGLRFYNGGLASDIPQVLLKAYGTSNYTGNFAVSVMQGGTYPNPMVERFTVQGTSGYVGIGTSSPAYQLDVAGNTDGIIASQVINSNAGTSARADSIVTSDSADIRMIATSAAYTGVAGWADTGIISTSSSSSGGLILNAQAGGIKFNISASEVGRFDTSGNLGIGTSSPNAKLELFSNADANFGIKIYQTSVSLGTQRFPQIELAHTPIAQGYQNKVFLRQQNSVIYGNYPSFAIITDAAGGGEVTRVFLDGFTGNFGIGATSPSTNLTIGGTAASGGASGTLGAFLSRGVSTNFYEAFDGTKSFIAGVDNTQGYAKVGTLSQHPVALVAGNGNGTFYMTTGSIAGLGTIPSAWQSTDYKAIQIGSGGSAIYGGEGAGFSPIALVSNAYVSGGGTAYTYSTNSQSAGYYRIQGNSHTWGIAPAGSGTVSFATAMSIDASGNLAVGGATAGKLALWGTGAVQQYIISTSATSVANQIISLCNSSASYSNLSHDALDYSWSCSGTTRFSMQASGILTSLATYNNTSAGTPNMFVQTDGTIYRGGVSALKYKQDIRDLELIDINKFRAVRYKSKCEMDDQTIDYFGIIADEVDAAGIKELVVYGADGEVESFMYERLTVVLLKNIQELNAKFDAYVASHP